MRFDILSLFPEYFVSPLETSLLKKAQEKGILEINTVNIRDFAEGKHQQVDDRPYGGGPGMVLMPDPVVKAIRSVKKQNSHVVYLSPQGRQLTAQVCRQLNEDHKHIILLCGHYEGVDERAIELEVDEEISVGDFVLTSGCPAALAFVDAVSRFTEGVVGHPDGVRQDSFESGMFDTCHYTRPPTFEGLSVPEVLLNGNHAEIANWRLKQAKEKTSRVRPDLIN